MPLLGVLACMFGAVAAGVGISVAGLGVLARVDVGALARVDVTNFVVTKASTE